MTLTNLVSQLWRRRTPSSSPRHLWAIITTTTADGATAHVQLGFTLDAPDVGADADTLDRAAMDAVETVLRHDLGSRAVSSLPVVGEAVDWVPADLVTGASIENVFVTVSDVEVTHELRRLVTPAASC